MSFCALPLLFTIISLAFALDAWTVLWKPRNNQLLLLLLFDNILLILCSTGQGLLWCINIIIIVWHLSVSLPLSLSPFSNSPSTDSVSSCVHIERALIVFCWYFIPYTHSLLLFLSLSQLSLVILPILSPFLSIPLCDVDIWCTLYTITIPTNTFGQ